RGAVAYQRPRFRNVKIATITSYSATLKSGAGRVSNDHEGEVRACRFLAETGGPGGARYRAVWMSVRPVARDWEWEFSASPAALWTVLADTARFNEAAGLPRYTVTDVPQPDGSVLRVGAARRFGLAFSWEEGVPQWIAGKSFAHERRFRF